LIRKLPEALGAAAAACVSVLGGFDGLLRALVVCVILDYLTGVTAACVSGGLSSRVGFNGILKKLAVFMVVALASTADAVFGANGAVRGAMIGFFIANEGLSVLENAGKMGLPVPKRLVNMLSELRDSESAASGAPDSPSGGEAGK